MKILLPTEITSAMILGGTNIPAVDTDAGEIAWDSSGTYEIDDLRAYDGGIYSCVKAHTATAQSKPPPNDPTQWLFKEPTNRMAPFDQYLYTKARKEGEIEYVLSPGFFDGFWMGGLEADVIDITLREESGGTILVHEQREMFEQAFGEWEYLFGNLRKETKLSMRDFPIRPAAELEVSVRRNNPNDFAELGTLAIGQWRTLIAPNGKTNGTQYGVEETPKSYSYMKRNDDGTYTRIKGRQAKIITASVLIDAMQAHAVSDLLSRILDIPVAVEVSNLPKYGHASTYGFVTGTVVSESWGIARVNIKVEGNV